MLQRVYPNTKPILTYTYLNLSGPVQGPLLSHSFPLLPKQLPSEDVEKKEPLYTVGGNVSWCRLWKTVWTFLEKLKIELPCDLGIPLLGICLKKNKNTNLKIHAPQIFIAPLFIIAKIWEQPKCPSTDEWIRRCGRYIQWNTTQP